MRKLMIEIGVWLLVLGTIYLIALDIRPSHQIIREQAIFKREEAASNIVDNGMRFISSCGDLETERATVRFALAITFTEMALSNPLERAIEDLLYLVDSRIPDFFDLSIGPAQIKQSTLANSSIVSTLRYRDLTSFCDAVTIVGQFIEKSEYQGLEPEDRYHFVLKYNGVHKFQPAGYIHYRLVNSVYRRLNYSLNSKAEFPLESKRI